MSVLQWGETISKASFKLSCIVWIFNDVMRDQHLEANYPGENQIGNTLPVFDINYYSIFVLFQRVIQKICSKNQIYDKIQGHKKRMLKP